MNRPSRLFSEDQLLRLQRRQLAPSILLTVVLALRVFFAPVLLSEDTLLHAFLNLLVSAALVYMAATTRRHLLIAGSLGLSLVVLKFVRVLVVDTAAMEHLQILANQVLLIYVFLLMIRDLFTAKVVDATILLLAINCYLVIGVLWALAYALVHQADPGAFAYPVSASVSARQHLYYFSFVTLTTLGYGDIQPLSPLARSLAIAESVSGVLFTGILVARLVGLYSVKGNSS
jgi:voltage-gated potassium channel